MSEEEQTRRRTQKRICSLWCSRENESAGAFGPNRLGKEGLRKCSVKQRNASIANGAYPDDPTA